MRKYRNAASAFALLLVMLLGATGAYSEPWKFVVMSDTQWPNSPDHKNPSVAVNVINHINKEFIKHGVKFVIQVGDLTDSGGANCEALQSCNSSETARDDLRGDPLHCMFGHLRPIIAP